MYEFSLVWFELETIIAQLTIGPKTSKSVAVQMLSAYTIEAFMARLQRVRHNSLSNCKTSDILA